MEDIVPDVEWWDLVVMSGDRYPKDGTLNVREEAISNLVEHPTQMKPPSKLSIAIVLKYELKLLH